MSSSKHNNGDNWYVYISDDDLLHRDECELGLQNCQGVSVCQVPISLKAAKPEAYIPRFVGLGPYHHHRPELIMTHQLKLGAAMRILKLPLQPHVLRQRLEDFVPDSDILRFYHEDANPKHDKKQEGENPKKENDGKPVHILTVDGLFLLGLLHRVRDATAKPEQHSYFLTGKHGLPMVNYAGVELTMDVIIRDVFMLENQIPTSFLKQITQSVNGKGILPLGDPGYQFCVAFQPLGDLGSTMHEFCVSFCPFFKRLKLSKKPEEHDHLLQLMYHLTVPKSEIKLEQEDEEKNQYEDENEYDKKKKKKEKEKEGNEITCSHVCYKILVYPVSVFLLVGYIVYKLILKPILWVLRSLYHILQKLFSFISPVATHFDEMVSIAPSQIANACGPLAKQVATTSEEIGKHYSTERDKDKDARPVVTIPSVTELNEAGFYFLPVKGGISSIKFDGTRFYLPKIKVNAHSEVLFRNLVAYETLTKTKGLIFTRYIELMRAIIDTPQDVKLLVEKKIIYTKLSDEVVERLFNGMNKSIRPTKTPVLDKKIKSVKDKYDETQTVGRFTRYVYSSWRFLTFVTALVFLALTAVQTYCSVFGCSPTSKAVALPEDGDYAKKDNAFMNSI